MLFVRSAAFAIAQALLRPARQSPQSLAIRTACGVRCCRTVQHVPAMMRRQGVSKTRSARGQARFYAVHRGRDGFRGILPDWASCKLVVERVPGAVFKSFLSREDAVAFVERGFGAAATASASASRRPSMAVANLVGPNSGKQSSRIPSLPTQPSPIGQKQLVVYTDGACTGNGRTGARAGVGVYFGDDENSVYNVSEPLQGPVQTNQRAELTGVLLALLVSLENALVQPGERLLIRTDSKVSN
jgi:ribonuclease HI